MAVTKKKPKAKKRVAKKAVPKKKTVKKIAAKRATAKTPKFKSVKAKTPKKAPAKKKPSQPTATDQVLKIIKRSKKGVNAATLMKKTGFDLKKVRNILNRTYKQGKIQRVEKGIYVGA